jgi:hypothetical protein
MDEIASPSFLDLCFDEMMFLGSLVLQTLPWYDRGKFEQKLSVTNDAMTSEARARK